MAEKNNKEIVIPTSRSTEQTAYEGISLSSSPKNSTFHGESHKSVLAKAIKANQENSKGKKMEKAASDQSVGLSQGNVGSSMPGEIAGLQNGFTSFTAGLVSPWTALFSREIFNPVENYKLNAAFYLTVPYLFAGIMTRARYSVGVGYEITGEKGIEDSAQVEFVKNLISRLKIDRLVMKIAVHRDVYGNAYLYKLRGADGHIIRLIPVQPERMRIRLSKETSELLGYIFQPPQLVIGQIPHPITLYKDEIVHFKQNDFTEFPYGISLIQPMLSALKARYDINIMIPMLYRRYAKPWVHMTYNSEALAPSVVNAEIDGMIDILQTSDPDTDLVTSDRWKSNVFGGGGSAMNPDTTIQDIDRQIFSVLGVPETYFKATGTTDRMISEQDKGFITMMTSVQEEVSRTIMEEVIIPELQLTFGAGSDIEVKWEWNAITDERQSQLRQDAINLYQSGLIMLNEARKLVGMQALDEEEVGELKDEHQSVGTPETVDELISSIPEDEVPELPEDMQPSPETVDSREEKLKLKEELKQIKPETNPTAPVTKAETKPFMSYDKSKLANLPEAIRGKKVKLLKDEHGNEYAVDLGE